MELNLSKKRCDIDIEQRALAFSAHMPRSSFLLERMLALENSTLRVPPGHDGMADHATLPQGKKEGAEGVAAHRLACTPSAHPFRARLEPGLRYR